ncbi:hypothetical protein GGR50DRAFT_553098 [Xylaria sp. CBS 124048]|nr:hypothetical protein GGR50DRAFT_553098 [Xylaria sp. CBS 124048]
MGRTEPTIVKPPAAFRRDARAKRARATVNKVIPTMLHAHPRAQRGIERSELIVDPPAFTARDHGLWAEAQEIGKTTGTKRAGRRKTSDTTDHAESPATQSPTSPRKSSWAHSITQRDEKNGDGHGNGEQKCASGPRISLVVADTLTAAHSLLDSSPTSPDHKQKKHHHKKSHDVHVHAPDAKHKHKVGILNMASPLSPGGGFLNGATSQEESLCMRTTLLPGLRDEYYRLPELAVVYTPDVLVFRPSSSYSSSPSSSSSLPATSSSTLSNTAPSTATAVSGDTHADMENDILPKNDRWFVDVVSAAMLRLPETDGGRYTSANDRELVRRKMRAVMRVLADKGCSRVVLGAWGCGAYGNPVAEIADAWRRVLKNPGHGCVPAKGGSAKGSGDTRGKPTTHRRSEEETWASFIEHVVFAIRDPGLAGAFSRAFGEDLLPVSGVKDDDVRSSTAGGEDLEENSVAAARVNELRAKIEELEVRLEQVRSPQLREGLESVLMGLRRQLPDKVDEEEEEADPLSSEGGGDVDEGDGEDDDGGEEDEPDEEQSGTTDIADVVEDRLYTTGSVAIRTR